MAKFYEGMFLTHNKEARKDTDYLAEHVKGLIEKAGGEVVQMTKWDERKLAYPIKGVTHGVYFLTWLKGDASMDARLRAEVRLSGLILRHMTLVKEKLPEGEIETAQEMHSRLSVGDRDQDGHRGGGFGGPPRSGGHGSSSGPSSSGPSAGTATATATPATATAPATEKPATEKPATEKPAAEAPAAEAPAAEAPAAEAPAAAEEKPAGDPAQAPADGPETGDKTGDKS